MNKIVSGNKRKTNAKLHYTLKILRCTKRHITKNVSEYKHTANAELQKCRKIVNIPSTIYKKVSENKRKRMQNCTTR